VDQKGEGVEYAEVVLAEFFAEGAIESADVVVRLTTPCGTESSLLVRAGTLAPQDAEADEVGVGDTFDGYLERVCVSVSVSERERNGRRWEERSFGKERNGTERKGKERKGKGREG
jgi:hypothetical protein